MIAVKFLSRKALGARIWLERGMYLHRSLVKTEDGVTGSDKKMKIIEMKNSFHAILSTTTHAYIFIDN